MDRATITRVPLTLAHLPGALRLSQQAGWPHRLDDWRLIHAVSQGYALVAASDAVVGTAVVTPYGDDLATISMVIIDAALRGRGLGRALLQAALPLAGTRPVQLVATEAGRPLYDSLGFRAAGCIQQHQGLLQPITPAPDHAGVQDATPNDLPQITALDRAAFGADRRALLLALARLGRVAVILTAGQLTGYAILRPFGRGAVIGPVLAADETDARALISHLATPCAGTFLRLDIMPGSGLAPWLTALGLPSVSDGLLMRRTDNSRREGVATSPSSTPTQVFGLASQGFG